MLRYFNFHKEFILGLLITLSLLWPLFAGDYFTHHDDVQVIRIYEMDKCFKDHQIPCRWVPDLGGMYGYPLFNYYAPLPYYVGEFAYLSTGSLLFAAKFIFALSFIGAYVFMYLLGAKLWGKMGGSLSAIFYALAPYHALNFYVRGAMGEMWALMLFPAVFWAAVKLEEKSNIINLLLFGGLLASLITSHNLSVMIFSPLILIWIIILSFRRKNSRFLWLTVSSVVLALLLSAFYLLPVLVEKNLAHLETMVGGYFSYTEHFKGFKKLLVERSWQYGSSIREVSGGEKDGMSYQVGWIHLLGWLLALFAAKALWNKKRWLSLTIIFSSLVIALSIYMINPRSEFIWKSIDSLKYLQFPWRFLLLVIFFISLIPGSIFLVNFKRKNLAWMLLILTVVVLNFSYFRPEKFIQTNDDKLLSGKDWDKQIKRSIFDYLPIYAKEPPAELATQRYQVLTGDSRIYNFKEGTDWITFNAETRSHTIIRLSQYYFPNWKVYIDGQETKVEYKDNSLGLMTIILGKGNHQVLARLEDTPIRTFANIATLVGLVTSIILFLISFEKVRGWITYYRKRMN